MCSVTLGFMLLIKFNLSKLLTRLQCYPWLVLIVDLRRMPNAVCLGNIFVISTTTPNGPEGLDK